MKIKKRVGALEMELTDLKREMADLKRKLLTIKEELNDTKGVEGLKRELTDFVVLQKEVGLHKAGV